MHLHVFAFVQDFPFARWSGVLCFVHCLCFGPRSEAFRRMVTSAGRPHGRPRHAESGGLGTAEMLVKYIERVEFGSSHIWPLLPVRRGRSFWSGAGTI